VVGHSAALVIMLVAAGYVLQVKTQNPKPGKRGQPNHPKYTTAQPAGPTLEIEYSSGEIQCCPPGCSHRQRQWLPA